MKSCMNCICAPACRYREEIIERPLSNLTRWVKSDGKKNTWPHYEEIKTILSGIAEYCRYYREEKNHE